MPDTANIPSSAVECLKVSDFMKRGHTRIESLRGDLSDDDTLMEGAFLHQELRKGLFLHLSDAQEKQAFAVKSQISEGFSCVFFMKGAIDLRVGDRCFEFSGRSGCLIEATTIVSARQESFERRSTSAQPVRHLVISASPEWFGVDGLELVQHNCLARVLKDHLRTDRWPVTPRMAELLNQISSCSGLVPELRNLYLEGRVIELIGEALAGLMKSDERTPTSNLLSKKDGVRLERAKNFISANLTGNLTVEVIAREAGINPTSLQHLFRLNESASVFDYVRMLRLEQAFLSLRSGESTVLQASLIAGYSHPTNFAKAFRGRYNMSPREALKQKL